MSPYLRQLHESLNQRWRPEDVLRTILAGDPDALPVELAQRVSGTLAAQRSWLWSSMSTDFARPAGGQRVLESVSRAFQQPTPNVDADDPKALRDAADMLGGPLHWSSSGDPDCSAHLTRQQRAAVGIGLSRRKYNRQWRALRRLDRKARKLTIEQAKRELILIGRSGFTHRITPERFEADPTGAHFVAYWVARKNLRRQFSLSGRSNPMDEVAQALLDRCATNPSINWEMIAYARPAPDVLARLSDEQKGDLLGQWMAVLRQAAQLLKGAWDPSVDRTQMIVRRGQDSSTWNTMAQAYNTARASWLACITALGAEALLDVALPGKVMRLMAADLAYWHRSTGGDLDPNTTVWAALPPPWEVLDGQTVCTRADVEAICRSRGMDPVETGWTAPKPTDDVATFQLTPELVHGVSVADPAWAALLRRAGVFSGKHLTADRELAAHALIGLAGGVVTSELPTRVEKAGDW